MVVRRFVSGLSLALAFAPRLLAQVGFPLFTTDFPPEEFAKRRADPRRLYTLPPVERLLLPLRSRGPQAMRSTRPGQYERELDAVAKFVFYRNGAQGDAYYSLIASGQNAWWPHYNAGKRKMEDSDFLLMDYAPDVGYYMSDVTRMWPVNGTFSPSSRSSTGSTSPVTRRF